MLTALLLLAAVITAVLQSQPVFAAGPTFSPRPTSRPSTSTSAAPATSASAAPASASASTLDQPAEASATAGPTGTSAPTVPRDETGNGSGFTWGYALVATLVLTAGVGATWLLLRRRKPPTIDS
jgi:cobalamin biosynthesis Mg chelatase CobN